MKTLDGNARVHELIDFDTNKWIFELLDIFSIEKATLIAKILISINNKLDKLICKRSSTG